MKTGKFYRSGAFCGLLPPAPPAPPAPSFPDGSQIKSLVKRAVADAAVRLAFGARAFREELHIAGPLTGTVEPVTLNDEHGPVHIYPVPFLDVMDASVANLISEHKTAMETMNTVSFAAK